MHKSIATAALAATILTAAPAQARDGYIGEVFMTGSNFCPRNTLPTDGRLLPISQNTALFSLLGTMYGGDGRTTFALPKLEGPRAGSDSANANQKLTVCIVTQGIFPSRS